MRSKGILERAEARARFRAGRRPRAALLAASSATLLWALADLVAGRHERLLESGAFVLRHFPDHFLPVAWTAALVLGPVALSLKPPPVLGGFAVALLAGPVLTPVLFGSGGWKPWQIAAFLGSALGAARLSRGSLRRPRDEAGGTPRPGPRDHASLPRARDAGSHPTSGASFHSRSSS